jgi:hypothetical protein
MPKKISAKKSSVNNIVLEVPKAKISVRKNESSSIIITILGIVAVIVALGVAGYFVYINYFAGSAPIETGVINPANYQMSMGITVPNETTDQATQDPTAGWLSYGLPVFATSTTDSSTSTEPEMIAEGKAFNFLYPNGFVIQEGEKGLQLSSDQLKDTQVTINWSDSKKPLAQYVSELDEISKTAWEGKPSIEVVTSTNNAIIAGVPAVVRQQKSLAADLEQFVVYVKNNDRIYTISLLAPKLDSNLGQFFSVFLSKFNFAK